MNLRERIRVLVADDMSTSRGLIVQALDGFGISNIQAVEDGTKALQAIAKTPFHLVISDMNMPNMNGLELLHRLRTSAEHQRIGFILITGQATPEIVGAARKLKANNIVVKPFDSEKLKNAIEMVVGRL